MILLSCEHFSNRLPSGFSRLINPSILETHRGYDIGAEQLFRKLLPLSDAAVKGNYSRLLVELNRNRKNQGRTMIYSMLEDGERESLLQKYHDPYWEEVMKICMESVKRDEEIKHISIHTFTPVFDGNIRKCDIGILYDPSRENEKEFAAVLKENILELAPELIIRKNFPYRGCTDSVTTSLRKIFRIGYTGMEIEVNNRFFTEGFASADNLSDILFLSVSKTLEIT